MRLLLSAAALAFALAGALAPNPSTAQTAGGEAVFRQRCAACHTTEANKTSPTGPNLRGVVGRKAGTAAFAFSTAIKRSDIVWTTENLDRFLAAPARVVPGTRMIGSVTDAAQRRALIQYLSTRR